MITKIFSMDNEHSTRSTWRQERVGHSINLEPVWREKYEGICTGMALVWLKKSIAAKGAGINDVNALGPTHLMAIVHGAYSLLVVPNIELKDEIDILTHMLISQSLTPGEPMSGRGYFDPAGTVDWVLREPCHSIFSFGAPQRGARKGCRHVIGMRYEGEVMDIFDPNKGLFRCSDVASFKEQMETVSYRENADCLGGKWAILKATSAID